MREQWSGKPRGDMLPVHVPVIIPCPFRGLKDQRGPWDPSCDRPGAVRSLLTPVASSGEDNIGAFLQGRTAFPGARRKAPALQRAPQGDGGASGLMSLEERRPQLPVIFPISRPWAVRQVGCLVDPSFYRACAPHHNGV
jgi:hypothetical protein